jgi:hypothetical protein
MSVFSAACTIRLNAAAPATCRRRRVVTASATAARLDRRSAVLLLLSAAGAASPANAASIGLFGIRKKLERAEDAVVEAAEVGGEAVKETVEAAEKEVMDVAGEGLQLVTGGEQLVQAAVVAGAEALGVVVGLSVVNGILKPES